jgi:small-conductance mechanosensitive channel
MAVVFFNDPDISPGLLVKPEVGGPEIIDDWAIRMRVMVKTHSERRLEIIYKLQKSVLRACEREGLSLTYLCKEIWVGKREVKYLLRLLCKIETQNVCIIN